MIVTPYRRAVPRLPVGLVTARRRVLMEDGSSVLLRNAPKGVAIYADAHLVNERFLRRGDGWCHAWNDRPVRWFPDLDHQVIMLQGFPGDSEDVLAGLVAWRDFLYVHGARVGSPASASASLYRATVTSPTFLGGGKRRPRFRVVGGRQEAFGKPGVYGAFLHVDISAAYGSTLGALRYPPGGAWVKLHGLPADEGSPCLVRARVRVPEHLAAGPLPVRPRRRATPAERATQRIDFPTGRVVQGLWSRLEVAMAQAAGCEVRVIESYLLLGPEHHPFRAWWRIVEEGRRLPGYAGELMKQVGNTLWGRFALEGVKTLERFTDGRRVAREVKGGANPDFGAPDVSELVASTVRARLYAELIAPHADRLISVHTDGGLVRGLAGVGGLAADWRIKSRGSVLVYLGPQVYAWRADARTPFTYVVSGISPASAPAAFGGLCRMALGWPPTVFGKSLAARDRRRLEALTRALGARPAREAV